LYLVDPQGDCFVVHGHGEETPQFIGRHRRVSCVAWLARITTKLLAS
jgi:hypothetical protein